MPSHDSIHSTPSGTLSVASTRGGLEGVMRIGTPADDDLKNLILAYLTEAAPNGATLEELAQNLVVEGQHSSDAAYRKVQRACKELRELDPPPIETVSRPAPGIRGRPLKIYRITKPQSPLTIRILAMLGEIKVREVVDAKSIARELGAQTTAVETELHLLRRMQYVRQSDSGSLWRLEDGVIPPEMDRVGSRDEARVRILQYLGDLPSFRAPGSTHASCSGHLGGFADVDQISIKADIPSTKVVAALVAEMCLEGLLMMTHRPKTRTPCWSLAPGVIPPEGAYRPATSLQDVKRATNPEG